MKHNVLWVEDGVYVEVANFAAPVFLSSKFLLDVALNVSEAIKKINEKEFAVIIVDIRIPLGNDPEIVKFEKKLRNGKKESRLGLQLLYSLFKPEEAIIKLENIPSWLSPNNVGIFSIENEFEIESDMEKLKISHFEAKRTGLPSSILLEFIEKIFQDSQHGLENRK